MPKMKIVMEGGEELKAKLRALGQAVVGINREAALAGAEVIEDAAEMRAPGPYISKEVVREDENQVEVAIGPDKKHWYYQFIETGATSHEIKAGRSARREARQRDFFGVIANYDADKASISAARLAFVGSNGLVITEKVNHPGMAARPFMRPAVNEKRDVAKDKAGEVFREEIEKASRGD